MFLQPHDRTDRILYLWTHPYRIVVYHA